MKIIRDVRVAEKIGCKSRATVWRKAKSDASFPQPVKVSEGITGWIEAEVDAYLERLVAEARKRDRESA
jgi:prophage regulatory protein